MRRDDHSYHYWLYPTGTTNAGSAAHSTLHWCAAIGAHTAIMSDGPKHFRNETSRLLEHGLKSRHHFTLPYFPWSNGAVERLGKELLQASRPVLSGLQVPVDNWPQLLPSL